MTPITDRQVIQAFMSEFLVSPAFIITVCAKAVSGHFLCSRIRRFYVMSLTWWIGDR